MIREYLLKCEEEIMERKIDLENKYQKNELKIKENKDFISRLESTENCNYDPFKPYNDRNEANKKKIAELKQEYKNLIKERQTIESDIVSINRKLSDLEQVIQYEKEYTSKAIIEQQQESNKKKISFSKNEGSELSNILSLNNYNFALESMNGIIHKIELCNKLIDIDRERCKLEIESISKVMIDIYDYYYKLKNKIYYESSDGECE